MTDIYTYTKILLVQILLPVKLSSLDFGAQSAVADPDLFAHKGWWWWWWWEGGGGVLEGGGGWEGPSPRSTNVVSMEFFGLNLKRLSIGGIIEHAKTRLFSQVIGIVCFYIIGNVSLCSL